MIARARQSPWSTAVGVYLVYAAVRLWPIWSGALEPKWDGLHFNYPAFAYAVDALRHGRLPLWNPYTGCGQPFISDPHFLWYQPGAVVAGFLRANPFDAFMMLWSAIWVWAGLGALLLAAVLGAGPVGAVVAAISYSLSGFFVGHGQNTPYLVTAAWFPWVLAFAHRAVARTSWSDTLLAGAALGLSALGGYGGLVIFEGLAAALWLVLAFLPAGSWPASEHPLPLGGRLRWIATVLAVSAAILAVVWSPSLWAFLVEARPLTDATTSFGEDAFRGGPFPPGAALTFLFPRISIDLCRGATCFGPGTDVAMANGYAGALALPLAAIWLAHDRARAGWLAALVAFWFLVSLGAAGGLRTLLHHLLPVTRYMHQNGMLRALFLAPLAAAAGVGMTRLLTTPRPVATWILTGWVAVVALCAALVEWRFQPSAGTIIAWTAPALVVAVAAAVALWTLPRRVPWLGAALVVVVGADLAWHFHTNLFTIADPPPPARVRSVQVTDAVNPAAVRLADSYYHHSKLNLLQHVPAVEGFDVLASRAFAPLLEGPFRQVLASRRYWLSPGARPALPRDAGVAALARLGSGEPLPVFVEAGSEGLPDAAVVPGTFGKGKVIAYAPERIELVADIPPGRGAILASTERFAPSWRVHVDGIERPLLVVNYFFRGVRLPPGRHEIVFEYRPWPFAPLLGLSYATLAAAICGALAIARRRRAPAGEDRARQDEERPRTHEARPQREDPGS